MFPLHDDNPSLSVPVVTYAIVALNVAAWILLQGAGSEPALSASVCQLGLIPAELLGLARDGLRVQLGPDSLCVLHPAAVNRLSPLSSMFMHGGWLHLLGNMWFLWIFGNNVEDSMGRVRFVMFYLLCGLAAAAAQVFSNPSSPIPMVGASGAIGGVMGAYALLYPHARVHMLLILGIFVTRAVWPAWVVLGWWFALNILSGLPAVEGEGGGVAFWAHAGGFVAGLLLCVLFRDPVRVAAHRAHVAGRFS
jgi:membrane associated rhomboid family serine protease